MNLEILTPNLDSELDLHVMVSGLSEFGAYARSPANLGSMTHVLVIYWMAGFIHSAII